MIQYPPSDPVASSVAAAYGWETGISEDDALAELLAHNLTSGDKKAGSEQVGGIVSGTVMNVKVLAMNLIRYIWDHVSESGRPIGQLSGVGSIIDAPSEEMADSLVEELERRDLVTIGDVNRLLDGTLLLNVNISLESNTRA